LTRLGDEALYVKRFQNFKLEIYTIPKKYREKKKKNITSQTLLIDSNQFC